MGVVKNHPKNKWGDYFASIKQQCPWSYAAWLRGQIDIVKWEGEVISLGKYEARVYLVDVDNDTLEKMAQDLDHGEYEWLFSYPEYGEYATPENVLIQQSRERLTKLRNKL